jgi:hypothetical protein
MRTPAKRSAPRLAVSRAVGMVPRRPVVMQAAKVAVLRMASARLARLDCSCMCLLLSLVSVTLSRNDDGTCTSTCSAGTLYSGPIARSLTCSSSPSTYITIPTTVNLACVRTCPLGQYSNGTHCVVFCAGGSDPEPSGVCPSSPGSRKGLSLCLSRLCLILR